MVTILVSHQESGIHWYWVEAHLLLHASLTSQPCNVETVYVIPFSYRI